MNIFNYTQRPLGCWWGRGQGMMEGYGGYGMGGYGSIGMIVFWALLMAAIVLLIVRFATSKRSKGLDEADTPLDILRKRYARGEIGKEEFEEKKKDLV